MSLEIWFSFVLMACVAVLTPGPAVLLAMNHSTQFGVKRAVFPILGNITGLGIMTGLTAYGLGSVLETSSQGFFWLRIAGGAYLIYLGIKLLRTKAHTMSHTMSNDSEAGHLVALPSWRKGYLQGVAVALSNPKAILFIGALFPQFVDVAQPVWGQFATMGLTLMSMSFMALVMYAAISRTLVSRGRQLIENKINKISGALFVVFGAALAAGSR